MNTDKNNIIRESHRRSRFYGVTKDSKAYKRTASEQELNRILRDKEKILNVAVPYLKMMYTSMSEHDFIIILTDEEGCILYINGEEKLLREFTKRNLILGAYMDEESIGTNAMGTAIKEDKPIQITAAEHYIDEFYGLTCLAAPIHDQKGRIVGTLNITGHADKSDEQKLDMVVFGVKVIENAMTVKEERKAKDIDNFNKISENNGAFYEFEDIVGKSEAMQDIIKKCRMIADSPSTVLIEGESGTGKEILAQSIHNYSYRKNNKFIPINCGAIPANIVESELFGYEDGTFTGARRGGKAGKIEMANGGTLFLDEVGEMPMDIQVKLLRVLQEGRIMRVGGYKEIPVDIRVIAATNRDLKKEIEEGRFREDLYYRLCVIPINVPPLRERKEDIEELVHYFLKIKSMKLKKDIPGMDMSTMERFVKYSWPGNIRQLENSVESYVNFYDSSILPEDYKPYSIDVKKENDEICTENCDEISTLEDMEKMMIEKAIKNCDNNISRAAKKLGISRNTIYLKIKKYNIKMS